MSHRILLCMVALVLGTSACPPSPPQPPRERTAPPPAPTPVTRRPQRPPPERGDPDDPATWLERLKRAHTTAARETVAFHLFRIYEVGRKQHGKAVWARRLAALSKTAGPALATAFRRRIDGRLVAPHALLNAAINLKLDDRHSVKLLLEVLRDAIDAKKAHYGSDGAREKILARATDGVIALAGRGHAIRPGLTALAKLVRQLCSSNARTRAIDPNSDLRLKLIRATPRYLKHKAALPPLERILVTLVRAGTNPPVFGQPKVAQDAMITILAMRLLGDLGSSSARLTSTLVASLLGTGRGRRFFSFAATALAKLPVDRSGRHPALPALLAMLRGDPFGPLPEAGEKRRAMPRCPLGSKLTYVCRLFWTARVEEWHKREPGVIPMNAMMVLRELAATSSNSTMLKLYGVDVVRKRWLAQARKMFGMERTRDKDLPGVQMQRMMIETYGEDMNLRSVMLRALGRMARGKLTPAVARELHRSFTWAGDPSMMVKAGEGAYLAPYDAKLLKALIKLSREAASPMMVNFKKRQVKMFFWGKVARGTCQANSDLEQEFKKCLHTPPPRKRGQPNDANWLCFDKFKRYWLDEFRYAIKFHRPGELKKLVHPRCRNDDDWWNRVRPGLIEKDKAGDKAARRKLYACEKKPSAKAVAAGKAVKCNTWTVCDRRNNMLCLDGHWQLRLHFHKHASLLATAGHARKLSGFRPKDLMKRHKLRVSKLPRKGRSAFYDSDDGLYLKRQLWGRKIERARLRKAKQMLEQALCRHRRFLRPALRCKGDVGCYLKVLSGTLKLTWEDCEKVKAKRGKARKRPADWRARLKALRMLAHFGRLAGPTSTQARQAVRAAVEQYTNRVKNDRWATREVREMVLLVLDRVASYPHHKALLCRHPYQAAKKLPCFRALKEVIVVETNKSVRGMWQINRDARNCLGRLARRFKVLYRNL